MNTQNIISKSTKYLLFGLAIAISVNVICDEKLTFDQIIMICISSSFIYSMTEYVNNTGMTK